jgi:carbon-monoxide dehydrogenase medium subunit
MMAGPFAYRRAETSQQACELLREFGEDGKLLAGGQSLIPMINLGLAQPSALIDISRLRELDGLELRDGLLRIGAAIRYRALEQSGDVRKAAPLVAEAIRYVGNQRIRNVGTVGGSIAHADPAAELPLVFSVLEATYEVTNGRSQRSISAIGFAQSRYSTLLAEDELLVAVKLPGAEPGWGWGFQEIARNAGAFAMVAVAALVRTNGGVVQELRLGVAGIGDRAIRCRRYETAAVGSQLDDLPEGSPFLIDDLVAADDPLTPATYRLRVANVLARRAVTDAWRRSTAAVS